MKRNKATFQYTAHADFSFIEMDNRIIAGIPTGMAEIQGELKKVIQIGKHITHCLNCHDDLISALNAAIKGSDLEYAKSVLKQAICN